jgi:S1-C subfamily serine protease
VHRTLRTPRRAVELIVAAVAGGAIVLGGAAALGKLDATHTVVRESAAASSPEPAAFTQNARRSIHDVYEAAAPGVVHIAATTKTRTPADPFFGIPGATEEQTAVGSGFVIDKSGHIITNYHVVAGASDVRVSFSDNESMKARIVGVDPSTDIAVLQVGAHSRALTPLPLGNSDTVHVGDAVVAIGNPFGLERTVTAGIISALQRVIQAPDEYSIDHVIQTDAALNKGSSGGPLLDAQGRVIGVNSQIQSGTGGNVGVGFAVPIDTVKTVAAQLIKTGRVEHAFLGIRAQAVTPDVARLFRLRASRGLLVASVQPGSAAAKAGLHPGKQQVTVSGETYPLGGDLIVSADGVQLSALDQLRDVISGKQPGDTISLGIWRGDNHLTLHVKLGRQPSP